jgi:hypothetical protein
MAAAGTANGAMSTAMSAAEISTNLKKLHSELEFIFSDSGVHKEIQAKVVQTGFDDCRLFAKADCGQGEAGIRAYVKDDLGIDPAAGILQRSTIARITIAWESARKRITAKQDSDAQQRTEDGPRTILKNDYVNLCRHYEDVHKEMPEHLMSGQSYLEMRLDQLEDGNLIAEGLHEVVSQVEDKHSTQGDLKLGRDGRLRMARSNSVAAVPTTPEQLRTRYKVMSHHWELARLKLPSKGIFEDYSATDTWLIQIEWLLGEDVMGYTVKDEESGSSFSLPWKQLLELEFQIRRKAMNLITNRGRTLVGALEEARREDALLQKYLYIPMGIAAGIAASRGQKRGRSDTPQPNPRNNPREEGNGAGNGAGRGKVKAERDERDDSHEFTGWKAGGSKFTPDGRAKCLWYQKGTCTSDRCGRVHLCFVCHKDHPQFKCPRRPDAKKEGDEKGGKKGGDKGGGKKGGKKGNKNK